MTELLDARPTIEVADLPAALAFFTDVIGMEAEVVMGEPPMFAIVGSGAAQVGLFEVDAPAALRSAPCFITLTGLDELVERITTAGIALAQEPVPRPWGIRDVVVDVPGGGPQVAFGEAIDG